MVSKDDRKAAVLLLGLAAAGLVVRLAAGAGQAPGSVLYQSVEAERPNRDSLAARASRLARPLVAGEKIDIDRAPAEDLARLPRIGAGLAARIIADREAKGPFGSLQGLDRVVGIGPAVLEVVQPHAVFSGRPRDGPRTRGRAQVRLNRASEEELAQLPGIGPVKARAIVADRAKHGPYRTLSGLTRVRGIGPATVERLRTLVVVP